MTDQDASAARRKLTFLAGFALYFTALWLLWDTPAIYPVKIFVVMLHEISHGIASLATGGTIDKIILDPYQGGACHCGGGNAFLTLSAGYLGSLLWGVVLLGLAGSRRVSNHVLLTVVGGLVVLLTALYVRNGFGLTFGLGFGTALVIAGRKLGPVASKVILTALGLTSCLYAILDIKSDVLDRPHLQSDAAMLAEMTPLSTTAWGAVWIGVAVIVSGVVFVRAYRAA
ncbi:MAG: M50 family metallopeptidase [Gemmatimonadetes bacterium]|nr:M50 family metallopeptidase [Gemmatimonadota bacterium]MYB98033.1 M50 family metallopeptidase [Gemmatimonadota bacterium]MYH51534.1 M50 family metallopeptidase [Gemmatimonadota bacterium]MYK66235.1 M50 family metallopeptidase [Gemmatimonadota bacterium]